MVRTPMGGSSSDWHRVCFGRGMDILRWRPTAACLALALLASCAREAPVGTAGPVLTSVVLQTNWYAEPEYGGYYQALAKGYFRDEGLDVRIAQGGPGAFPVQKVAAGQVQFAVARSDDLIMAARQGLPVLIVAAQLEHDPQVVVLHAESPVRGFRDLDGKSIMVEPGSAWISYVERKYAIHIKVIPENYENAGFLADRDFIEQGFLTAEPYVFSQLNVPTRTLLVADSGYDPYRALFCNRAFAAANPEIVRAFVRASLRGWKDYLSGDPAPGNRLITLDHAESTPALLAFGWGELRRAHIVDGDPSKGESLCLVTRRRLESQIATMRDLGLVSGDLDVGRVASFDFLPEDLRKLALE